MIHGLSSRTPVGPQGVGEHRYQVVNDPVDGGLAGVEQCGQGAGGQVRAQVNQYQQQPYRQWQAPGPATGWRHDRVADEREHVTELVGG